jgi:predicted MFS family arabinose efflux permease
MSDDLGVSVAAAGQAMTAYAITSAFLSPLAIVAMGRWRGNLKPLLKTNYYSSPRCR